MFHGKCQRRIIELERLNEEHRLLNGRLRQELDHWQHEAKIWRELYDKELKGGRK